MLISLQFGNRFRNVGRLRKYCVLELRRVRDKRVERANAANRGIEFDRTELTVEFSGIDAGASD